MNLLVVRMGDAPSAGVPFHDTAPDGNDVASIHNNSTPRFSKQQAAISEKRTVDFFDLIQVQWDIYRDQIIEAST